MKNQITIRSIFNLRAWVNDYRDGVLFKGQPLQTIVWFFCFAIDVILAIIFDYKFRNKADPAPIQG